MIDQRPFSQACENNKAPILQILKSAFAPSTKVLEIGSGTGQHAVHFAANLAHLLWQPTERQAGLPLLQPWLDSYQGHNLLSPIPLEIGADCTWPDDFDAAFSANTAHILPWELTQLMLAEVAKRIALEGVFALYGPFNYNGQFTSASNAQFNEWLKEQSPHSAIRHFEEVNAIIEANGMALIHDHAMPANNRLLVWKKLIPGHTS